ncbi:TRAP transporter substrate-binding protein DctP [Palleronia sp. LCG004]|uniref:TRAP transporter substrate-binding protein DctP n=1 Tax=Palleronia sp. LCG004 TaxID=3079304 RepID=UPI002943CCA2|nr:TRAP transporter substrate-binding protein DctP [Palleronia sp. LCG004]WOI57340.1 TRAP transporter substrate-binding protein DctP [Palleronia sp. LCG004]
MPKHLMRATLAALLATTAIAAQAQDVTLRATANSNENDEDYDGLVVFKNYVEQASNGSIAVELFIGTQLCSNGQECMQGVADGSIDIFVSTSGGTSGIFPFVQVLDLPYVMADDRIAEGVLEAGSDFMTTMQDMVEQTSGGQIKLMTIGNTGGWRNFANTQRRVETPEDLAGLKIRTVVADLPQELTRALGAAPTPIPWPELFTSLQTGVVEGTKNGITDIMGMRFPDAGLQYMTLDGHAYMGALWFMNGERFASLDDLQKRIVVDGFYQLQQATFASPKRKSIEAYQAFQEGGGDLYVPTPEQMELFSQAAEPVYEWFQQNVDGGAEIYEAMTSSVETVEAEIDRQRQAVIE